MPYVAALKVELHFSDIHDLKAKRKQLSSLKSSLTHRFNVSVSEVAHQDLWQRSTLAVAAAAESEAQLSRELGEVERFIEARAPDGVRIERRFISFDDLDL